MNNKNEHTANYIKHLQSHITNFINRIGFEEDNSFDFEQYIYEMTENLREITRNDIVTSENYKALDAFDNEFKIYTTQDNYKFSDEMIDKMIDIAYKNPDIPISESLLHTPYRFSVIYDGLDREFIRDMPVIVNVPADIFRYLQENNYDNCIIKFLSTRHFGFDVNYDYVTVFKKILKLARNYQDKLNLIDITDKKTKDPLDPFSYVTYKASYPNVLDTVKLKREVYNKLGDKMLSVAEKIEELNIHSNTVYKRIYDGIKPSEAIKMGVMERNKYGVTNDHKSYDDYRHIFIKVIEEKMKEEQNTQNNNN